MFEITLFGSGGGISGNGVNCEMNNYGDVTCGFNVVPQYVGTHQNRTGCDPITFFSPGRVSQCFMNLEYSSAN